MLREQSTLITVEPVQKKGRRRREGTNLILETLASLAPVVYITSTAQAAEAAPVISPVGAQVLMTVGIIGVQLTRDSLRVTFTAADALHFLRRAGNGSFAKGLGSVSAVNAAAMIVPTLYAAGYSLIMGALQSKAQENEKVQLIVLFNVLENPLLQSTILGVPALAAYGLTKHLIYKSLNIRKNILPASGNELSLWKRAGYAATFRAIEGVGMGELMLEAFRTFGPALVVHSPFSTVIPVVLEQWVIKPLREYRTPTEGAEVVSCLSPKAAALYAIRSTTVIASVMGLSWLVLGLIDEDRDPETMTQPANLFYELALITVALLIEQAINLTPPFRENTGTWYHKIRLFSQTSPELRPLIESEYDQSALYEDSSHSGEFTINLNA